MRQSQAKLRLTYKETRLSTFKYSLPIGGGLRKIYCRTR